MARALATNTHLEGWEKDEGVGTEGKRNEKMSCHCGTAPVFEHYYSST